MKNNNASSKAVAAIVYSAIALWFAFALITSINGGFVPSPDKPPRTLGLTFGVPTLVLLLGYFLSRPFRAFAHLLDLRLITGLHAWRIVAVDFLVECGRGRLPATFSMPAGFGDIITGVGAMVFVYLMSKKAPVSRKRFVAWNIFGLVDLITAVSLGILHSESAFGILRGAGVSTALMAEFPRAIIPAFLVPLFILLHLLALARRNEVRADSSIQQGGSSQPFPATL